jgi:transposase InsO family protein
MTTWDAQRLKSLGEENRRLKKLLAHSDGARALIERWRLDYNTQRPHSAHDGLTPANVLLKNAGDRLRNPDQLRRSPAPIEQAHQL